MLLSLYSLVWSSGGPTPTFIEQLPVVRATMSVGYDEDFILAFAAFQADGVTPLGLTGISFALTLTEATYGPLIVQIPALVGSVTIGGAFSNQLTISVPAANKTGWDRRVFQMHLVASDGTFTKDVFAQSTLTVGEPAPLTLQTVAGLASRGVLAPI